MRERKEEEGNGKEWVGEGKGAMMEFRGLNYLTDPNRSTNPNPTCTRDVDR